MNKMSSFLKSLQLDATNCKNTSRISLPHTDVDQHNFKYVPIQHFKDITKVIKRKRIGDQEDHTWASFVEREWKNRSDKTNLVARTSPDRSTGWYENGGKESNEGGRLEKFQNASSKYDNLWWYDDDASTTSDDNRRSISLRHTTQLSLKIPDKQDTSSSDRKPTGEYQTKAITSTNEWFERSTCPDQPSNTRYSNNKELTMYTRPNPRATFKILTLLRKMVEILDEISLRLDNVPSPESDNDLRRRQQRVTEFATRFSRNYLYNLGRCMIDLQNHLHVISSSVKIRSDKRSFAAHMRMAEQKLLTTLQLSTHALTAYRNNIPSAVIKGRPGKLKDILQIVITLQDICDKMQLNLCFFGAGDTATTSLSEVEEKCTFILAKLKMSFDHESQDARKHRSNVVSHRRHKSDRVTSDRYSMYRKARTFGGYVVRNRKLEDDAKKIAKKRIVALTNSKNSSLDSREGAGGSTTKTNNGRTTNQKKRRPREDDIQTMMDLLPVDSDENDYYSSRFHGTVISSEVGERASKNRVTANKRLYKLITAIANVTSMTKHKVDKTSENVDEKSLVAKGEQQNTRLTHIVSTNGHETPEEEDDVERIVTEKDVVRSLSVSDETNSRVSRYRSEYKRWSKLNPMYTSDTQNKPWDIVSWISDKLVDELTVDIAKELEMDDVIQRLFDFEFLEF